MQRKVKGRCGLFGCWGPGDAVQKVFYGLYSLQHRGQESAGIASTDGKEIKEFRGMGLVADVFKGDILKRLENRAAIGHLRYSTTGSSSIINAQPFVANFSRGKIAIAHNGNLVNATALRKEYEAYGSIFQTTMDTEVIVHIMAKPENAKWPDGLLKTLRQLRGAFSLLMLTPEQMIGVRDAHGWRPLLVGEIDGGWSLASESCAFDLVGARLVREVEPGEVLMIGEKGIESLRFTEEVTPKYCTFEHVYFARPDSNIFGDNNHSFRVRLGKILAREHPADADIVVPVPDSGVSAALGYSLESGIPLDYGFIRNHYIGRTFIEPSQALRDLGVDVKLNVVADVVRGKRIVVVDDSLIRGTTSRKRIRTLRAAGAREVHMRISCPPTKYPCFFGIDFPGPNELIANRCGSIEEIREVLGLDSLGYLSLEGLLSVVKKPKDHYCHACWSGEYPIEVPRSLDKLAMERT